MAAFGPFTNRGWTLVLCGSKGRPTKEIRWDGDVNPPAELKTLVDGTVVPRVFWDDEIEDGRVPQLVMVDRWRLDEVSKAKRRAWYELEGCGS
jgi:hypothetical protein